MIVVLSLNTAIDHTLEVAHLRPGEVHRAATARMIAGGKGLNVARVVRQLGLPVRVVGFLGGYPEPLVRTVCAELGIDGRWITPDGPSRTCVIVVDAASGEQTVVNEEGPAVSPNRVQALADLIDSSVGPGDLVCIAGSAPPGVPDDFYAETVRRLQSRQVRVLLDASGAALRQGLRSHPWAAAPNEDECRGVLGVMNATELARQLGALTDEGLVTLGAEGVLLATEGELWHLRPPRVRAINSVGSGDALVAGFAGGTERGMSPVEALALGVACGASNATRLEPGIESAQAVEDLRRAVEISGPLPE